MNTSLIPFVYSLAIALLVIVVSYAFDKKISHSSSRHFLFILTLLLFIAVGIQRLSIIPLTGHVVDSSATVNILWNTVNGRLWFSDLIGMNFLGYHPFYNIIFIIPFFLVNSSVFFLESVQCITSLSCSIIVYFLAQQILRDKIVSATCATIFLLYPPMAGWSANALEPQVFSVPFLLGALLALEKKSLFWFICMSTSAAFSIETFLTAVPLLACIAGIIYFRRASAKLLIFALIVVGLAAIHFIIIQPACMPTDGLQPSIAFHYSALGNSKREILMTILTDPVRLARVVLIPGKIGFVAHLLLPWLFLPLLAPWALIPAIPELVMILLSNPGDDMYKINCFYTQVGTCFIMWGALHGLKKVTDFFPLFLPLSTHNNRIVRAIVTSLLALSIGLQANYFHTLGRGIFSLSFDHILPSSPIAGIEIPQDAKIIVTQGPLATWFATQPVIYPNNNNVTRFAQNRFISGEWIPDYIVGLKEETNEGMKILNDVKMRYNIQLDRQTDLISIYKVVSPRIGVNDE